MSTRLTGDRFPAPYRPPSRPLPGQSGGRPRPPDGSQQMDLTQCSWMLADMFARNFSKHYKLIWKIWHGLKQLATI